MPKKGPKTGPAKWNQTYRTADPARAKQQQTGAYIRKILRQLRKPGEKPASVWYQSAATLATKQSTVDCLVAGLVGWTISWVRRPDGVLCGTLCTRSVPAAGPAAATVDSPEQTGPTHTRWDSPASAKESPIRQREQEQLSPTLSDPTSSSSSSSDDDDGDDFLPPSLLVAGGQSSLQLVLEDSDSSLASTQPFVESDSSQTSTQPFVESDSSQASTQPFVESDSSQASTQPFVESDSSQASTQPFVESDAAPEEEGDSEYLSSQASTQPMDDDMYPIRKFFPFMTQKNEAQKNEASEEEVVEPMQEGGTNENRPYKQPRGRPPKGKTWNAATGKWEGGMSLAMEQQDVPDLEVGDDKQAFHKRPCGRAPKGKAWCTKTGAWVNNEPPPNLTDPDRPWTQMKTKETQWGRASKSPGVREVWSVNVGLRFSACVYKPYNYLGVFKSEASAYDAYCEACRKANRRPKTVKLKIGKGSTPRVTKADNYENGMDKLQLCLDAINSGKCCCPGKYPDGLKCKRCEPHEVRLFAHFML
eukprot:SAG25_NODE_854_length_5065_cov_2.899690_2_plen_532_part_00